MQVKPTTRFLQKWNVDQKWVKKNPLGNLENKYNPAINLFFFFLLTNFYGILSSGDSGDERANSIHLDIRE